MAQTQEVNTDPAFRFIADLGDELSNGDFDLPAFPDNAVRITTALEDPDVTAEQAARIIGADPVFSARLLKVSNSAMFNPSGMKISDLRTAIARIGFRQAYSTIMSLAVEQVMYAKSIAQLRPYLQQVWHHSVQVAACSYVIARKYRRINPDVALLAGLLHDIGKFYILKRAENYPELFDEGGALETVMQDWHTGIGRSILECWDFSEQLVLVADEHEVLDRDIGEDADLVDIVTVANLFSHQIEADEAITGRDWDGLPAARRLKLSAQVIAGIYEDCSEEIASMSSALEGAGVS